MPELPEVETTKTSLLPLLNQQVLKVEVRQPSLRWPIPDDLARLQGKRLIQLTRPPKYWHRIPCSGIWVCQAAFACVKPMKNCASMII